MIYLLVAALIPLTCYGILTRYYEKHWMENFEVNVAFSEEEAGVGDSLYLYETATNKKKMKLPMLCVKFATSRFLAFEDETQGTVSDYFYRNDVMNIDGFQKVRRKLCFTCKKRGLYSIQEAELVSYDMLYSRSFVHRLKLDAKLFVYPALVSVEPFIPFFQSGNGCMKTNTPLFEDPFSYVGVREYTPQDSMRKIHWKASARMGEWQVKTTEYTASTPVVVLLNLESPGVFTLVDIMESSICLAYSLTYYFCSRGVPTRLIVSGNEKVRLEGKGRQQIAAVRRALAMIAYDDVSCRGEKMLEREIPRISLNERVVLISAAGKKPMQEMAECLYRRVNGKFTWIAPMVSEHGDDNELREVSPLLERCLVKWGG